MVIDHIDEEPDNATEPVAEGEELTFPQEITDKALDRLRAVIRGNGIKTESLTLQEIKGSVIEFEGQSHFKLETLVSDKRTSGREQGLVCGSIADVKTRIKSEVENLAHNKDIKKTTIQNQKVRQDKGFGVQHQIIKLDKHKHRYVIHESCNICRGDGKIECNHCRGKGREICNRCHGDRFMPCTLCRGGGTITNAQGQQQQCTQCRSEGRIPCRYCHQSGQQQCSMCKSTGQLSCHECNQSGWHSHVTIAQFKSISRFDYDKEKLPPEALPIIDDLGPELITEGHAQTAIIEDIARNEAMDKQGSQNEYIIGYDTKLPWADLTVNIKTMPVTAKVFGYNGETLFVTPFMEKITAKPLSLVNEASLNPALIQGHLKEAGKYRVIREIVFAASRYSRAKGQKFLETKYPFGYQIGTLEMALVQTDRILKNITQGPRKKGFILGGVAAAALYAAYIFSGASNVITPLIPLKTQGILPDTAMIALGVLASIYTTKITARNALHDVIGKLLPEKSQKSLMPKIGVLGIYAVALNVLVFICLQEIAKQSGIDSSLWYEAIRSATEPA